MRKIIVLSLCSLAMADGVANWTSINLSVKGASKWETHLYLDHAKVEDASANMVASLRFRKGFVNNFKLGFNISQFRKAKGATMVRGELALFYFDKWKNLAWKHRSRMERRYAEAKDIWDWRYRHAWYLTYNLSARWSVSAVNEAMAYSQFQSWNMLQRDWDYLQNRLDPIKVSYKFAKGHTMTTYFRIKTSGQDLKKSQNYLGLAYSYRMK